MEPTSNDSIKNKVSLLELYVVMNSSGGFFRSKGYGGYGDTWVENISKAKVYGKLGQARSRVTWFANSYPEYPPATIIKLKIGSFEVLQENERVRKAIKSKEEKEARKNKAQAKRDFESAKQRLDRAQQDLEETRNRVRKY